MWFYQVRRPQPGPGAEGVALAAYRLPMETGIGYGVVAGSLRELQPPQVWAFDGVVISGLGGIQAGQFVRQPLLDPVTMLNSQDVITPDNPVIG